MSSPRLRYFPAMTARPRQPRVGGRRERSELSRERQEGTPHRLIVECADEVPPHVGLARAGFPEVSAIVAILHDFTRARRTPSWPRIMAETQAEGRDPWPSEWMRPLTRQPNQHRRPVEDLLSWCGLGYESVILNLRDGGSMPSRWTWMTLDHGTRAQARLSLLRALDALRRDFRRQTGRVATS